MPRSADDGAAQDYRVGVARAARCCGGRRRRRRSRPARPRPGPAGPGTPGPRHEPARARLGRDAGREQRRSPRATSPCGIDPPASVPAKIGTPASYASRIRSRDVRVQGPHVRGVRRELRLGRSAMSGNVVDVDQRRARPRCPRRTASSSRSAVRPVPCSIESMPAAISPAARPRRTRGRRPGRRARAPGRSRPPARRPATAGPGRPPRGRSSRRPA